MPAKTLNVSKTFLKITLVISLLISAINLYSQNYIYKGSEQYPATSTWSFPTNSHGWTRSIDLTVGKTKTGGYMMLSAAVPFDHCSISGVVSLILANGKLITLTQRIVNDHVDDNSQVLYIISPANYLLLGEHDIEKIRFTISNSMMKTKENISASNKGEGYSSFEANKYYTAEEIKALED